LSGAKARRGTAAQKTAVADKTGGDSVLTVFVTLDMDKSVIDEVSSAHFFYTPVKVGLTAIGPHPGPNTDPNTDAGAGKTEILKWLENYYATTTYEISCPALRDPDLAPEGKTGLIVSTLMDYSLVKRIADGGWYEEFKQFSGERMIKALDASIFPEMESKVIDRFVSTPLTIEKLTGNSDGAITGWAFTNSFIPAVGRFSKIARSVLTPIPNVFQAGQWTYSPSGFPISILTGKMAADKVRKTIRKTVRKASK
jgi:phytoene dehydrogenase-like protein